MDIKSSVLGDGDVEGTPGDVLVPPLDDEDVAALFFDGVRDVVHPVAHVFDVHLLAGRLRPVDADHQHVGSCRIETRDQRHINGDTLVSGQTQRTSHSRHSSPALLQSTVNVFF